jgi:hypothetical protein
MKAVILRRLRATKPSKDERQYIVIRTAASFEHRKLAFRDDGGEKALWR